MDEIIATIVPQLPNLFIAIFALMWAGRVIEKLLENQQKLIEQLSARPATSIDTMPAKKPAPAAAAPAAGAGAADAANGRH